MSKSQNVCLELKNLIDQERQVYNEERSKFENDYKMLQRHNDAKMKVLRTKLAALYDGHNDQAQDMSLDEIIDHIAFRISSL